MCLLARTSSTKSAFLFLCFPGFREEPNLKAHAYYLELYQIRAVYLRRGTLPSGDRDAVATQLGALPVAWPHRVQRHQGSSRIVYAVGTDANLTLAADIS